jgi:hypothetical protein
MISEIGLICMKRGGAGERGSRGAGEQGSGGAGERGSGGAGEQRSRGARTSLSAKGGQDARAPQIIL